MRVLLIGAAGRMGKRVVDLASEDPEIDIVAQCDLGDPIEPAMKNCDVAIDFSHADTIDEICRAASRHNKPLVIGTTGHSQEQRQTIEQAARSVPIVFASNFSVGVNVLADAQSCRIARSGLQSQNHRDTSQNEKGCAERHGQNSR